MFLSSPTGNLRNSTANIFSDCTEGQKYSAIIINQLPYIEKQCRKAVSKHCYDLLGEENRSSVGWDVRHENLADELYNELLERLASENFKAIREFKGSSKITTYLTTIISNLIIDIIRSKRGRSRAKDRARNFGPLGELLYELVFTRGYSLHEAYEHLKSIFHIEEGTATLSVMLEKIGGREALLEVGACQLAYAVVDDEREYVVIDQANNAEEEIIARQRELSAKEAINEVLSEMNGEERLIIRMRFPADEEHKPDRIADIAQAINLPEKVVESRIRRILIRCRERLLIRGVRLDDLIEL